LPLFNGGGFTVNTRTIVGQNGTLRQIGTYALLTISNNPLSVEPCSVSISSFLWIKKLK